MFRSRWRAGWRCRIRFRAPMNGASDCGALQSRCLISYFSEERYSSLVSEYGSFSNSS
jgi:hypothetical protein